MNYVKLYNICPKAFEVARDWWGKQGGPLVACPAPVVSYPKDQHVLVRFFDTVGFHIDTGWYYEGYTKKDYYESRIYTPESYPDEKFCSDSYMDRDKAESEAIVRAFELLELKMIIDG